MKQTILILFLVSLTQTLSAQSFRFGLEGSLGSTIGTGKGYWDWMDAQKEIQRIPVPSGSLGLGTLINLGSLFQGEGGIGYSWNRCNVKNGKDVYSYRQNAVEIPLGLKLFMQPDQKGGVFIKGGTVLFLLTGQGRFTNEVTGEDMFQDPPERRFHTGIQLGLGYQKGISQNLWQAELRYLTFYTSPDYGRTDGTTGDVRYHRIQLTLGWFL